MKEVVKNVAEKAITEVVNSGVIGIRDVVNVYCSDYQKRMNMKFGFKASIKGAWEDTKMYCNDVMCGKPPRIMEEAVTFER